MFLLGLGVAVAQQPPDPPEEPPGLALEDWMVSFLDADPSLVEAAALLSAASSRSAAARTRQQTDLFASPSLGGGLDVIGQTTVPFASAAEASVGVQRTDAQGRSLIASVSAATRLPTFLQGPSIGGNLAGRIPLRGNVGGRLWTLEAEVAELDTERASHAQEATARARCFLGVELYVIAASLQRQAQVYGEFVAAKEDSVERTRRDVRRGLLRRLELLTAQTDLSQTRTEQLRLAQLRDQALASLAAWLGAAPERLDGARLEGWDAPALEPVDHPLALALGAQREQRRAEAAVVDQRYRGEIALVPELAAVHQGGVLDASGAAVAFTEVAVGVSLDVGVPLAVPRRAHELDALSATADAHDAAAGEIVRQIREDAGVARAALDGLERRLELIEARLALIDEQVEAAWGEFLQGRLEYQDWAQHYALYQSTRLEGVALELERDQARLALASVQGALPGVCR